jgi:DNA-binding MarR family transcriptional regulator
VRPAVLSCQHHGGYGGRVSELDAEEMALWHAWKLAADTVRARIAEDITAAVGLSDADFGVLTRVAELGGGRMRQNALAESMGWHRSRLSHQLSRMEQRGLVTRQPADGGVEVQLTDAGHERARLARPAHAAAVRRHLINHLKPKQRRQLHHTLDALVAPADVSPVDS